MRREAWPGRVTSARGAAMRSKMAPCGASFLLWRQKGGQSALLVLWGPSSLLRCPEEPLIQGGKGTGRGGG